VVRLIGEPAGKALPGDAEEEGEAPIELPDAITGPLKAAFAEVQRSFNGKGLGTKVYGRANIPQNRSAICVSNHSSHLDMGLVKYALGPYGDQMSALAAKDYFFEGNRWWVAYWEQLTNLKPLDREGGFRKSFDQAKQAVEQGNVVLIFPEGTRSLDGEIRAFKDGAFRLAITTGTPILPMAVHGTRSALRKHDWRMGDTNAEVRVLEPISTVGMTEDDIPVLRERVRDLIVAEVAKMSAAA